MVELVLSGYREALERRLRAPAGAAELVNEA
jgi:hypothetical protein